MFSISDIKQEAYPAAYRRGKELYERGLVQEFSYDVYTEDGVPKAELIGRVKGTVEDHYDVRLVIDEEYAEVSESRCNCEAFCNYEGICKHCVAVALAYVNRRQAKDILNAKLGVSEKTEQKNIRTEKELKTDTSLKNLLNRYSMRAGSTYLLPENIYGKVELELISRWNTVMPRWNLRLEWSRNMYSKIFLHFYTRLKSMKKSVTVKNWSFIIIWMHLRNLQNV